MKKKSKGKMILFKNKAGQKVSLPDGLTIEDLTKLGISVRLLPRGCSVDDHTYVHDPLTKLRKVTQ